MGRLRDKWDIVIFGVALLTLNLPLIATGHPTLALLFAPGAVAQGEWWRLLTHPFVHVSRYHLLLDGSAFLTLLLGLTDLRPGQRVGFVAASAAASLAAASLLRGETAAHGLCGLSGVGHGLMAATALLMLHSRDSSTRRIGHLALGLVVAKALVEAVTGHLALELLHLGDLGRPNRLCHLGGVIGGVLAASLGTDPTFSALLRRNRQSCLRVEPMEGGRARGETVGAGAEPSGGRKRGALAKAVEQGG
jgi:rhomboid family GlyGly-CTERM serine protease